MSDQERLTKLVSLLEKIREQKLGEEWQYKMELSKLEDKVLQEIKDIRQRYMQMV